MEDDIYYFPVSLATYAELSQTCEQSGIDNGLIFMTDEGRTVGGIALGNFMIYPAGGPDQQVHSGNLSDLLVAVGEEAFRAGYGEGCRQGITNNNYLGADRAWGNYEPSDAIHELQSNL